ncbi:amidohydrolase family protein [Novosphingobium flavum]|uniref:Amidohydrolase family protein n=1 Tax=Novosphingobium flavum TaxID=1778672 RepID=A0A7X1FR56_9SPHN|nr:amidohydrolase family protein [Novosphingobium flavum]
MRIVDAQVHIWRGGRASAHHTTGRPEPFSADDLIAEMDAAGIACAVLAPPTWDPCGNDPSLEAARRWPGRFTVTGNIDQTREDRALLRGWLSQPGMSGLRLNYNSPEKQAALTDGSADWIWEEAERADIPVMVLIPDGVPLIGEIARRHPALRVCIDHLGIPRGAKDAAAFAHLPGLLALAALPGVSVKVGGLPAYSTVDSFPWPSLHGPFLQVVEAFGPERIFWATDLTRMHTPYREIAAMFTEGMDWLDPQACRLIMGDAVCRWLDWQPAEAEHQRG